MPLTTTVGKFNTADSTFLTPQVRGVAALVEPKLTTTWDLIPDAAPSDNTKLRWYDALSNALEGAVRTGGWNIGDTTGLVITDATAAVINVGDMMRVEDEFLVVKAVDRTSGAATVDVHARGHGGSTAATHAAAVVIYITGSSHVEGTVDGDSILEDNVEKLNYMQLVEEPLQLTVTAKNQNWDDIESKMQEQRVKAMSRALRKLNLNSLFGVPAAGSGSLPRSAGGIRHFLSDSADNINTNVAGAFTEVALKATLLEIAKRGGTPNLMICSPDVKSIINGFNATASAGVQTRVGRDANTAGTIVDFYVGEGVGTIGIVADPLLRDAHGEAYILNTNKLSKFWFKDDMLRFEKEPSNSRTLAETLQGQFSFKMKDAATDHARMYGIT